jgi:hypothetical protein
MVWIMIFFLLAASTAQADVTRKYRTTGRIVNSYESVSTEYFAADRHAAEETTTWTSGVMKTMTGGKPTPTGTITRLDKQVIWSLDFKKKTYTEMTFEEFRRMVQKGLTETEEGEEEDTAAATPEDMYDWSTEVKSVPGEKTVNGFICRNVKIVATGVNRQDPQDKVWITYDSWNCPEVTGFQEIQDYHAAYLQALGLDLTALNPGLTSAAALYQRNMEQLLQEAQKAPGEPVTTFIEIKRRQPAGPSVKKVVGEAAQEELMGKLPFGKKKKPQDETPQYVEKIKYTLTRELIEASSGATSADVYEIPAGFKKVEKKENQP